MNKRWYECRVRYERTMDNGRQKRVNEPYLVDALSFTEAEERITREMQAYAKAGDMEVTAIKKENLSEVLLDDDGDRYYKVRVSFITLDEKTGKEKKAPVHMLVQAGSIAEAKERLDQHMKGTMSDYRVESIGETGLMDIYPYEGSGTEPCTTK